MSVSRSDRTSLCSDQSVHTWTHFSLLSCCFLSTLMLLMLSVITGVLLATEEVSPETACHYRLCDAAGFWQFQNFDVRICFLVLLLRGHYICACFCMYNANKSFQVIYNCRHLCHVRVAASLIGLDAHSWEKAVNDLQGLSCVVPDTSVVITSN